MAITEARFVEKRGALTPALVGRSRLRHLVECDAAAFEHSLPSRLPLALYGHPESRTLSMPLAQQAAMLGRINTDRQVLGIRRLLAKKQGGTQDRVARVTTLETAQAAQRSRSSIISRRSTGYSKLIRQVASQNTHLKTAARPHLRVIDGGCEIKTDFSLFIGVANALIFEALCVLAIIIVWYAGWYLA
jgi:hypothetical protein